MIKESEVKHKSVKSEFYRGNTWRLVIRNYGNASMNGK